jgi:hypothetical protein
MTLELFRCVPFATKLTRKACGERHDLAKKGGRESDRGMKIVGIERCATCPVGAAHVLGETPAAWSDGSPIEVAGAPSMPEPGRSKWTGTLELPSESPEPPAPPRVAPEALRGELELGDVDTPERTFRPNVQPRQAAGSLDHEGSTTMPEEPKRYTYNGKTLTGHAWADEPEAEAIGITRGALGARLRKGWSIKEALTTPLAPNANSVRTSKPAKVDEKLERMVRPPKRASSPKKAPPTKKREDVPDINAPALRVVWFAAGVEITSSTDPQTWAETFKRAVDQ